MTSYEIGRYGSKETAESVASLFRGKSYYNFAVTVAPVNGSFVVTAETSYPETSELDVAGMLLTISMSTPRQLT